MALNLNQAEAAQLMALSYTQPTLTTANYGLAAGLGSLSGATSATSLNWDAQQAHKAITQMQKVMVNQTDAAKPAQGVRKPMARLIRYTVTDPDHILADKKPESCILMGGTVMLNGTDDKRFLMDLAPKVAEKLEAHNSDRASVEYEDDEGRTKTLKPVKLSQLDVVVEVLKSY